MQLVDTTILLSSLTEMAKNGFGDLVKGVVDVDKKIMVIDTPVHTDE